jgi:molybdenum cofactor cytidylyltransferase
VRVTAIILAAGAATRFGAAKQHLVFRGETLLARAVRIAREAGCERVLAVIRPGDSSYDAERIENAEADHGISTSIRAGVLAAGGSRVLITLCDQPLITTDHLRALLAIDAPIVATRYAETIGVPAVFDARYAPELVALTGDRGARSVIEAHRTEAFAVPFEDAAVDVDTPEDWRTFSTLVRKNRGNG